MNEKQKKVLTIVGIVGGIIVLIVILSLLMKPAKKPISPPIVTAPAPITEPVSLPTPEEKKIDYAHDVYITKPGDTLWNISGRPDVYGNPSLWWYLVEPNLEIISYIYKKPDGKWIAYVLPDKKLIIPREKYTPPEKILEIQKSLVTYAVDLGNLENIAQAEAIKTKLRNDTYSAYLVKSSEGVSVRIGFFTNRSLAEFVGNEVVNKYSEITTFKLVEPSPSEINTHREELRKHFSRFIQTR